MRNFLTILKEVNMKIYKFKLDVDFAITILQIPADAKILCVQTQNNIPCIWVQCSDFNARAVDRRIAIYGTGNSMPDNPGIYIGTFQLFDGLEVWHVFEEK